MDVSGKYSRRSFLGKFAAGTISLSGLSAAAHEVFSSTVPSNFNETINSGEKKFVPVMITPYTTSLKIDFDALSALIDFYIDSGAKGLFANCLSSEMYHLDPAERLALAAHVVKRVKGSVPVVATGSFGTTNEERAEFAKKMLDTGVNAVILITSHFAGKDENDNVLTSNLENFLSLTGNIPVGTYECPTPYKRILTPEVFRFLLSTNRLTYHKDTTIDLEKIKVKLEMCKNNKLEFYDAHTPNAMYSLQSGAKGMSPIAGNFYPELFAWMCHNINDPSRQEDVKWLQAELTWADAIIGNGYTLSSKYFLKKRGVPVEQLSRNKNTPLTPAQKLALDEIFKKLPEWHERLGLVSINR